MFEHIQTFEQVTTAMKEFRETHCRGVSQTQFAEFARRAASIIPRDMGTRRGIIATLGELWACVRFGLTLMPEGNAGYDAVDETGTLGVKSKHYQIKSRHPEKGDLVSHFGTTPGFANFEFDAALLVLIDKDLHNYEIWLADSQSISRNLRHNRKDLRIHTFRTIGTLVYPRLPPMMRITHRA